MQANFDRNLPFFDLERDIAAFALLWRNPVLLLPGLPFSLTLLTILLAHEFGHYFACVYYRDRRQPAVFSARSHFHGHAGRVHPYPRAHL